MSLYSSDRLWHRLKSYSSTVISRDIHDCDKILLHSSLLDSLIRSFGSRDLPSPLIFEVENQKDRRISHVGVLEFTSPEPTSAYFPFWVMKNLLLNEGSDVRIRVKMVPKATSVTFQPIQYAFTKISNPKVTLEYALRKFTALTVGDTINIDYSNRIYELIVKDIKPKSLSPPSVGCVVNTSLEVEFEEPVEKTESSSEREGKGEGKENIDGNQKQNHSNLNSISTNDISSNVNDQSSPGFGEIFDKGIIESNTPICDSLSSNMLHLYKYKGILHSDNNTIRVEVKSVDNTPLADIYVGIGNITEPNGAQFTWKSNSTGVVQIPSNFSIPLASSPSSSSFSLLAPPTWYYISVHSYKVACKYQLKIEEIQSSTSSSSSSPSPHSSPFPSPSSASSPLSPTIFTSLSPFVPSPPNDPNASNPNYQLCSNCHLWISTKQSSLHSVQCQRINWYCSSCLICYKKSEKDLHCHCPHCNVPLQTNELSKHVDLQHGNRRCDQCHSSVSLLDWNTHRLSLCPQRISHCKYCDLPLPINMMSDHQNDCGAKSIPCHLCGMAVAKKRMDIHLAVEHNVNVSLMGKGMGIGVDQIDSERDKKEKEREKRDLEKEKERERERERETNMGFRNSSYSPSSSSSHLPPTSFTPDLTRLCTEDQIAYTVAQEAEEEEKSIQKALAESKETNKVGDNGREAEKKHQKYQQENEDENDDGGDWEEPPDFEGENDNYNDNERDREREREMEREKERAKQNKEKEQKQNHTNKHPNTIPFSPGSIHHNPNPKTTSSPGSSNYHSSSSSSSSSIGADSFTFPCVYCDQKFYTVDDQVEHMGKCPLAI